MNIFRKKYLTYALFFAAGSLVSGGAVFAATGSYVQAFLQSANVYVPNNSYNAYTNQLTYNGAPYINVNSVVSALSDAGVSSSWNGQTLTVNGTYSSYSTYTPYSTYYPSTSYYYPYYPYNYTASTGSTTPSTYSYTPSSSSTSLFDFPQFAEGTGDQAGTTAVYSSFVDNLGNRYLEPTLCWSLSSTGNSSSSSSNSNSVTLGNTLGQPYSSELINQHVNYQTFQATDGTSGTFSKIYNLNSKYSYLTFTLAPSAYYNNQPVNNNIGSLEIVNEATGTDIFNYSNFSSNITAPVTYSVPVSYVNQIEIIFNTDGLGFINPQLVK